MPTQMVSGVPIQYTIHPQYQQQNVQQQLFPSSVNTGGGNISTSNSYTAPSRLSTRHLDKNVSGGPLPPMTFRGGTDGNDIKTTESTTNGKVVSISKSSSTNSVGSLGVRSENSNAGSEDTIEGVVSIVEGVADDQPFFELNDLNGDGEEGF